MLRKRKENVSSSGQSLGLKRARCIRWESANNNSHSNILLLQSLTLAVTRSHSRRHCWSSWAFSRIPLSLACFDNTISSTPSPNCTSIRSRLRLPTIPINHLRSASTFVSSAAKILYQARAARLRSEPPYLLPPSIPKSLSTGHQRLS